MSSLKFLTSKYFLDLTLPSPISITNVGRNNLPEWFHELDFRVGAEIGVAAGDYSEIICRTNPDIKIYGIDPWKSYKGYTDYVKSQTFDRLYQKAKTRLTKFPKYIFLKETSNQAVGRFADNSLDFVYIDANHKDPFISEDLSVWYPKVKKGGFFAGHDYIEPISKNSDVATAVKLFTVKNDIKTWFIIGAQDDSPSWLIIKS